MIGRVQRTKGLPSTFSHGSERGSSGFHSYNNACASFSDYALFSAPYSILLYYLKRKIRVKSHCLMQPFSKSVSDRDCSRNQAGEKGVWEVKATITHLCHLPNEQQEPPNCCICFFFFFLQPSILLNKILTPVPHVPVESIKQNKTTTTKKNNTRAGCVLKGYRSQLKSFQWPKLEQFGQYDKQHCTGL